MALTEQANTTLETIETIIEGDLSEADRVRVRAAIEKAMLSAMTSCCVANASVVTSHLKDNQQLARAINEESESRRVALIASLSALR